LPSPGQTIAAFLLKMLPWKSSKPSRTHSDVAETAAVLPPTLPRRDITVAWPLPDTPLPSKPPPFEPSRLPDLISPLSMNPLPHRESSYHQGGYLRRLSRISSFFSKRSSISPSSDVDGGLYPPSPSTVERETPVASQRASTFLVVTPLRYPNTRRGVEVRNGG